MEAPSIAEGVMEELLDMVMFIIMLLELPGIPPPAMGGGPPAAGVAAAAPVVEGEGDVIIIMEPAGGGLAADDIEGVAPPVLAKTRGFDVYHFAVFEVMIMALKTAFHGCGYPPSDQVKDAGKVFGAAELCPRVFEAGLMSPQVVKSA